MIFTVIGIILRCLAYAIMWNSADEHPVFCGVITVIYIIFCIIGIIETYLGRYERPAISTILLFIIQIVESVYFIFAAESTIEKIIGSIVVFLVFGGIFSIFDTLESSGAGSQDAFDELDKCFKTIDDFHKENLEKARRDEIAQRERWENEKKEREQYVRDNWDSSLGRLNSDATMYETPDGNRNKISRDGQHYEDDYGDWQHI